MDSNNNEVIDLNNSPNDSDDGLKFEDNSWRAIKYYREITPPKMIEWVMKLSGGLIKETRQAEYVLLGFVIVAVVASLFLLFGRIPAGQSLEEKFPPDSSVFEE